MNTQRAIIKVQGQAIQTKQNATPSTWREVVATFIAQLDVRESSRKLYTKTLSKYFVWIEETHRNLAEVNRQDVLEYKDYLTDKGLAPLTIGSYIVALRKFYTWAEGEKLYPNIAKDVKTPKRIKMFKKQHLTGNKSRELLEYFESVSLRDYAIVNLLLRTGLRTIEVVRLNVGDITFKGDRRVLEVWGKGRDTRDNFVTLTDKCYEPIKAYLATRKGVKAGEPLFVSNAHRNTGERMTTRSISRICKEGLKAVNLDGKEYTAHSLRHTTGVSILKNGGSLRDVQTVLRHASPVTSQEYVESIAEELRLENAPEDILDKAF